MNILPKKKWHVRTKDNIARVRRDEAAAHEEERKKQEKLEFAESEVRINFLRKRSGLPEKHHDEHSSEQKPSEAEEEQPSTTQHVNLFADYKTHVKTTNKDLEKEKKEEQEKYEKQIGYLTYLGQDTNEALRLKSWYEVAPKRTEVGDERQIVEKDMKTKYNQDPLTLINALLPPDPKTVSKPIIKRKRSLTPVLKQIKIDDSKDSKKPKKHKKERKKHKKEKHNKHHKDHKEKKGKSKDRQEDDATQKRLKLDQLRKERLNREMAEKARQDVLLAPKETIKQPVSVPAAPRVVQKYNSQFNPELAKQNMN